jgi:sugar lactone lactonase YvrE
VKLDRDTISPISQSSSEIQVEMPHHDNGYAIVSVGGAHARFLYVPSVLRDLPASFITTVAGIGLYVGEYGPANSAAVRPWGLAFDGGGLLYFADSEHNRVFRVRDGLLEPFAGTGFNGLGPSAQGGPALDTPISFPRGIAFDSRGNLYVPDTSDHIWRFRPDSTAEIVAGTGRSGFSGDGGPATAAHRVRGGYQERARSRDALT